MDFVRLMREVMTVALEFERGAPADNERIAEQGLQRDDDLLPAQGATLTAIDATNGLLQPAGGKILAA